MLRSCSHRSGVVMPSLERGIGKNRCYTGEQKMLPLFTHARAITSLTCQPSAGQQKQCLNTTYYGSRPSNIRQGSSAAHHTKNSSRRRAFGKPRKWMVEKQECYMSSRTPATIPCAVVAEDLPIGTETMADDGPIATRTIVEDPRTLLVRTLYGLGPGCPPNFRLA